MAPTRDPDVGVVKGGTAMSAAIIVCVHELQKAKRWTRLVWGKGGGRYGPHAVGPKSRRGAETHPLEPRVYRIHACFSYSTLAVLDAQNAGTLPRRRHGHVMSLHETRYTTAFHATLTGVRRVCRRSPLPTNDRRQPTARPLAARKASSPKKSCSHCATHALSHAVQQCRLAAAT